MATVSNLLGTPVADTTNAQTYTTGSMTPNAGDLLVVLFAGAGTQTHNPTVTDSLGGTYVVQDFFLATSSTDIVHIAVANQLASGSALTITVDYLVSDPATGCIIFVAAVSGMFNTGTAAIKQHAGTDNGSSGVPITASFGASCLTGDPTLGLAARSTLTNYTPPTNWTEQGETSFLTPTLSAEYVSRDSGFTGTAITWVNNADAVWGAYIIELSPGSPPASIDAFGETQNVFFQQYAYQPGMDNFQGYVPNDGPAASPGLSAILGLIVEDGIVQALSRLKSRTLSLVTETGTAQAVTRSKSWTLGLITETGTVQALSRLKSRTLSLLTETGTVQPLTKLKTKVLGLISETGTVQPLSRLRSRTLGLISETGTVQSLSRLKTKTLGLISEIGTAQPITRLRSRALGLITETGTAQVIARRKSKVLGLITENGIVLAISSGAATAVKHLRMMMGMGK